VPPAGKLTGSTSIKNLIVLALELNCSVLILNLSTVFPEGTVNVWGVLLITISLLLKENPYGHMFTGIETGIENVYDGLDVEDKYLDDMGKRHVVRFNLNMKYQYNCNT
jgi:hypothetical protein